MQTKQTCQQYIDSVTHIGPYDRRCHSHKISAVKIELCFGLNHMWEIAELYKL